MKNHDASKRFKLRLYIPSLLFCGAILAQPDSEAAIIGLSQATASFSQSAFGVNEAIDGITTCTAQNANGWAVHPGESKRQTAVFETIADVNVAAAGGQIEFKLIQDYLHPDTGQDNHQLGRFMLSYTTADRSDFADGKTVDGQLGSDSIWTSLDPIYYKVCFRDGSYDSVATLTGLDDNSMLADRSNHRGYYVIDASLNATSVTGFRIDAMTDASLPFNGPGREPTNGNFVLTEFQVFAVPEPSTCCLGLLGTLILLGRRMRR